MKRNDATTGATIVCVHSLSTRRISREASAAAPMALDDQRRVSPRRRSRSRRARSQGHRLDVDVGQRVGLVLGPQSLGRVPGDQTAAADQGDVLAQLLGLLEVVRRQEDRRPQPRADAGCSARARAAARSRRRPSARRGSPVAARASARGRAADDGACRPREPAPGRRPWRGDRRRPSSPAPAAGRAARLIP